MADWKKVGKGFALGGPVGAAVAARRAHQEAAATADELRAHREFQGDATPPMADPTASSHQAFTARGRNGQLTVTPRSIVISREGALGFISHGHQGRKEIDIRHISSIQFKESGGATAGYIQFAFLGGQEAKRGLFQGVEDENTILFGSKAQPDFLRAKELIDEHRDRLHAPAVAVQPVSSANELAKFAELHRQGVLTDEEFAAKKLQLLGL
jgi:hypothetical protein